MKNIKVNIISTKHKDSLNIKNYLISNAYKFNIKINKYNPDVVIAIGGDGTYLKALREYDYDNNIVFLGVNTGHVGFMTNLDRQDYERILEAIANKSYQIENRLIQNVYVKTRRKTFLYKSLNDVVLREVQGKTLKIDVKIDGKTYQHFRGDGVICSTPTGSTAYNMSLGHSIVVPGLECIQVAPLSPITNSYDYRSISNSLIVPHKSTISIMVNNFNRKKLMLNVDGEQVIFKDTIDEIIVVGSKEPVKNMIIKDINFIEKLNNTYINY